MDHRTKSAAIGFVAGVLATLVVAALAGIAYVYAGGYNIAATEEHMSLTRWAFDTTFQRSVETRAADLAAPANITPEMIAAGGRHYKATCQTCHAGPGVERAEWASGMRPRPPHLAEAAAEWEIGEIFWLARHGAKMTGMPAFGPTHDDETLWNIAAFVSRLPAMTPEQYAAVGEAEAGHGHGSRQGGHEHGG